MAALLRSVASKTLARAAAPTHRLHGGDVIQLGTGVWYRGLHSRTSPPKVFHTTALAKARAGVAYAALFGSVIYLQFWVKPAQEAAKAKFQTLYKQRSDLIDCLQATTHAQREMIATLLENKTSVSHQRLSALASGHVNPLGGNEEARVKQLEATVADLQAEIADLKIALDSARSQGKF